MQSSKSLYTFVSIYYGVEMKLKGTFQVKDILRNQREVCCHFEDKICLEFLQVQLTISSSFYNQTINKKSLCPRVQSACLYSIFVIFIEILTNFNVNICWDLTLVCKLSLDLLLVFLGNNEIRTNIAQPELSFGLAKQEVI